MNPPKSVIPNSEPTGNPEVTAPAIVNGVHDARSEDHQRHVPMHAQPGTGKRMLVAVAVLAIVLTATYLFVSHRKAAAENSLNTSAKETAEEPLPVNVVHVQYGSAIHTIALPGETHAWYESTIYARVSGYLKQWNVDIGDEVKAGQVLAIIETPELDQQLTAAKAKFAAAEAQVKLAQANEQFSDTTLARYKDAPKGVVSDLERDERGAENQTNIAREAAAESDLNSAQAEIDRLQDLIAFQKVTAPFDGTITERRVDIGDLVTAGSTVNTTSLFRIAQSTRLRIFTDVPQSIALAIRNGDDATALWNGRSVVGKVARNSQAINPASKTLRVEVDVSNKDLALLPGMYVDVQFQTQGAGRVLQVPASALIFRSGGPCVAVVSPDDHVEFHPVTIARDLGNFVEIGSGLSPQDLVALNISNQISNGDVVKPNLVEDPTTPAPPPPHAVTLAAPVNSPMH